MKNNPLLLLAKKLASIFLPSSIYERTRSIAIDLSLFWKSIQSGYQYDCAPIFIESTAGQIGLEIGGPSWLWKSKIPIYKSIKKLDNVNWASVTANNPVMQDGLNEFEYYLFKKGRNIICEADAIPVSDSSYDFLISSQVLEHIANPLKILFEWRRVIRNGGHLICLVPRKDITFDYMRPTTTLSHLLEDFKNDISHDDLTHLEEVVELTDDFREPAYETKQELRQICLDNLNNRLMHHHVYDLELLTEIVRESSYQVISANTVENGHIILARNVK